MPSSAIAKSRRPKTSIKFRRGYEFIRHKYNFDDVTTFHEELAVMSAVGRIPALANHAPQLVSSDPENRALIIRGPAVLFMSLYEDANSLKLDVPTLLRMEESLRAYLSLAYRQGIAYTIRQDFILLLQKKSSRWTLFLGGWGLCSMRKDETDLEWNDLMMIQLENITRLFGPLKAAACAREEKLHPEISRTAQAIDGISLREEHDMSLA